MMTAQVAAAVALDATLKVPEILRKRFCLWDFSTRYTACNDSTDFNFHTCSSAQCIRGTYGILFLWLLVWPFFLFTVKLIWGSSQCTVHQCIFLALLWTDTSKLFHSRESTKGPVASLAWAAIRCFLAWCMRLSLVWCCASHNHLCLVQIRIWAEQAYIWLQFIYRYTPEKPKAFFCTPYTCLLLGFNQGLGWFSILLIVVGWKICGLCRWLSQASVYLCKTCKIL